MKTILAAAILSITAGCSVPINRTPAPSATASSAYATITVDVSQDGPLESNGTVLRDSDLAPFAKEVGNGLIVLRPQGNPTFGTLVAVRQKLWSAGAGHVVLQGFTGG